MRLIDAYDTPNWAKEILYRLLAEREPHQNISHKEMPTWEGHCKFFESRPYLHWWLIMDESDFEEGQVVGAAYLTKNHEIGIGIFKQYQRKGHAKRCLSIIKKRFAGVRLLANVNELNEPSLALFRGLGFKALQITLTLGDEHDTQKPHTSTS